MSFGLLCVFVMPFFLAITYRVVFNTDKNLQILQLIGQVVVGALLFSVAAPLIGACVHLLASFAFPQGMSSELSFFKKNTGIVLLGAYAFFGVPAFFTGLVAGSLVPFLKSWRQCFVIGLISLPISVLWSSAISNPRGSSLLATLHWIADNPISRLDPITPLGIFISSILLSRVLCKRPSQETHPN